MRIVCGRRIEDMTKRYFSFSIRWWNFRAQILLVAAKGVLE